MAHSPFLFNQKLKVPIPSLHMVTEVEAEAVVEEVEDWLTVVEVKLVVGAGSHRGSEGS